jgi:putative SOS response-associated peptidase YedK
MAKTVAKPLNVDSASSMCGRYSIEQEPKFDELGDVRVEWSPFKPRYNVAPTQRVPIIRLEEGALVGSDAKWGLVPVWAKDPAIGNKLINARGETVAEKPSFRSAFKSRRCLVPADGFYEWEKVGKGKQPWRFVRKDRKPFLFAGLWERWRPDQAADWLVSFTIITTTPNHVAEAVHERMPVILGEDTARTWIDPKADREQLQELIAPCPDDWLERYPIGSAVSSPANDRKEIIQPIDLE